MKYLSRVSGANIQAIKHWFHQRSHICLFAGHFAIFRTDSAQFWCYFMLIWQPQITGNWSSCMKPYNTILYVMIVALNLYMIENLMFLDVLRSLDTLSGKIKTVVRLLVWNRLFFCWMNNNIIDGHIETSWPRRSASLRASLRSPACKTNSSPLTFISSSQSFIVCFHAPVLLRSSLKTSDLILVQRWKTQLLSWKMLVKLELVGFLSQMIITRKTAAA